MRILRDGEVNKDAKQHISNSLVDSQVGLSICVALCFIGIFTGALGC